MSGYLNATIATVDRHTIPSSWLTGAVAAATGFFNQVSIFKDARTGAANIPMANSGYVITQTIAFVNGAWQLTTSKAGAAVTANGYSSQTGTTTPNPITVTILSQ